MEKYKVKAQTVNKTKVIRNAVRPSLIALAVSQAVFAHQSQAATLQTGPGCNLASAIISANNDEAPSNSLCVDGSGVDTIELNGGVRLTAAVNGATGLPVITSPLTINGNGRVIRRDANAGPFRILEINTTESVTLSNLTITNGLLTEPDEIGAGIIVRQANEITLDNVTIKDNSAIGGGGGIALRAVVTATIRDSVISSNSSAGEGGGLFREYQPFSVGPYSDSYGNPFYDYYTRGSVRVSDSTIEGNSASNGGGIFVSPMNRLLVKDSSLTSNFAEKKGGAIYSASDTTILGSTVSQNTAAAGGGLYERANDNRLFSCCTTANRRENALVINRSTFANNAALSGNGGAVNAEGTSISTPTRVKDSVITGNTASGSGGGLSVSGDYYAFARYGFKGLRVEGTVISSNSAGEYGGAINGLQMLDDFFLRGIEMTNNHAQLGGGGVRVTSSPAASGILYISNSVISENTTGGNGGAVLANDRRSTYCRIYNYYCDPRTQNVPVGVGVSSINSTISGNTATEKGGAVAVFTKNGGDVSGVRFQNTTVVNNSAAIGGGLFTAGAQLDMKNSLVAGNLAGQEGSEIKRNTSAPDATLDGRNLLGSSQLTNAQAFSNFLPDSTDITATIDGTQPTSLNLILEPLQDNGGDTLTHALVDNSPAIDNGFAANCTLDGINILPRLIDQRGLPRADGACDIGAYEVVDDSESFSVSATTAIEGEDDSVVFTITLNEPKPNAVSYDFITGLDYDAPFEVEATPGADYIGRSGRITFPAGVTQRERRVKVIQDAEGFENDETFALLVSAVDNPLNAVATEATIIEGGALPYVRIEDVRVEEGSGRAVVEIELEAPSTEQVRVRFATVSPQGANNPATDGEDYVGRSGVVVFQPGETRKTRTIELIDDDLAEANELFRVDLSDASNAVIREFNGRARVSILNDD